MPTFREAIDTLLQADIPTSFKQFGNELDADFVQRALSETGVASVRRRKFPAEMVVWLVIGMALFRDRCIQEIVSHLGLVFGGRKESDSACRRIAPSAIPQARYRLGAKPLERIFKETGRSWAREAAEQMQWKGLGLYGVDGTTLRIADTKENRERFGAPSSRRAGSGYPQVRLVALMSLRAHLLATAAFGPYCGKQTGELSLARQLWDEVADNSLCVLDKLFLSYADLYTLSGQPGRNRHWIVPAKTNLKSKRVRRLGKDDALVEVQLHATVRRDNPDLPESMVVRAIRYRLKGFRPRTLFTTLLDAEEYPADEIVALYHERWELELGYDEIKTHMLEREEALRSKKPEGVEQEIWGILLAYNLVRCKMLEVSRAFDLEPNRISFRHSLQLIRVFCLVEAWTAPPTKLPRRLEELAEMVSSLLVLPERRPERRYERAVKIKMSNYKRNTGRRTRKSST
jgi:hypothetical protein